MYRISSIEEQKSKQGNGMLVIHFTGDGPDLIKYQVYTTLDTFLRYSNSGLTRATFKPELILNREVIIEKTRPYKGLINVLQFRFIKRIGSDQSKEKVC